MHRFQGAWALTAAAALGCLAACGSSSGSGNNPESDGGNDASMDSEMPESGSESSTMDAKDSSSNDSSMNDSPTGDGPGGDSSTDAADAAALPIISNIAITPNPNNILSATLTFDTNVPTTASVTVANTGDGGASNTFTIGPTTGLATSYSLDVLGMRAQSSFLLTITAKDASSNMATGAATYATGPLPAFIPPITIVTNDPTKTSPGFTLMTIWAWDGSPAAGIDNALAGIVALDPEGQVVWYYYPGGTGNVFPTDPKKLPNGDLVMLTGETGWAEIDMMGNVVQSYTAGQMGLDTLHHEIFPEKGTSNYLSLSTELRMISGYPTADGGTTTLPIVGDVIAEFGADGGVTNQWHELDMLDPMREGDPTMFNAPFYNSVYQDAGLTKDWSHANAIVTDPNDGTIVVSSRTQGWAYKFAPTTDGGTPSVIWKLGAGGDFTLTNSNETFNYGQHGVNVLANGDILMFDDGNNRPAADGGINDYSRAVEFSLDTTAKTATIVWQYQEQPSFFAQFLGSAYLLPNGNVLLCAGGLTDAPNGGVITSPSNLKYARIMEVTHDASPTKILEYEVRQELNSIPSNPTFSGYSVYRATRIPSLY